jgi:CRP-like cAMP-binding protein
MAANVTPSGWVRGRSAPHLCRVLEEDPDLALCLSPQDRASAVAECVAPVQAIPRGRWSPQHEVAERGAIGLLVLQGLLVRRSGVDGRSAAELLGAGDLLQPWRRPDTEPSLRQTTAWRVLEAARVAVLDFRVAHRFARHPELIGELVGRALVRSRSFAVNMAIVQQPKVEVRLRMLFWHLADRWGRVAPDGVRLPLRLTHTVLSDLVAARRPTVSSSLSKLARQGLVTAGDGGWLLSGPPPTELLQIGEAELPGTGRPLRSGEISWS